MKEGILMIEKLVHINGMTCHHCVMAVKKELTRVDGVLVKDVQVGEALIAYDEGAVTADQIRAAVEEAGYTLVS
jgi:copper chaperone